jgi:methanogenic corrinoid protein MtbC1
MDSGVETAHGMTVATAMDAAALARAALDLMTPVEVLPPWAALLGSTIESEVLPRLVSAHRAFQGDGTVPGGDEVAAFVALIVAEDIEQARAVADRIVVQYGGREALLDGFLAPAARLLGEMWDRDECDFLTVTLGVYRLDQIMKETATAGSAGVLESFHEFRILLLPAPGEQHSFGLGMVADVFRQGGWCVRSGPAVTPAQLLGLVRDEWFDVVGLSVATDRHLKGLAGCMRALRHASCNPNVYLMLGGAWVTDDPERARFLGADAMASSAAQAFSYAKIFIERAVTECLHQSKTRLVDIG